MNTGRAHDWQISYMSLAGMLSRRRGELGISQDGLATALRVGRRSVQRWEAGDAYPSGLRLFQWAAQLGVQIAPQMAHPVPGRAA
ncbi:MAG: helix-turn-helix transcriptional regulator [Magnetospirillum sp.]|nr:helix-turn-helix transcriptional regulator [Magnetospirillum sp.]